MAKRTVAKPEMDELCLSCGAFVHAEANEFYLAVYQREVNGDRGKRIATIHNKCVEVEQWEPAGWNEGLRMPR